MTGDDRKEFMLHMYSAFWDCVSRAEDSAWKMIAAYVALFAGMYFLHGIIGPGGVASIFIIFSFVAIVLSLRGNAWFLRNMGLISNLEKEFLDREDYEILVPRFFANPQSRFLNWEIWMVQAVSYFGVCIAFLFYIVPKIDVCEHKIVVAIIFTAGLLLTMICGRHYYNELKQFFAHAPGKQLDNKT